MRRRLALGVAAAVALLASVALVPPERVYGTLTWLAADPLRFGAALAALAAVRPLVAWPTTLLAVAAGFGYGLPGVPVGVALLTLTGLPPYLAARRARGDGSGRVAAAGERVVDATGGVRAVAASRFLPTPSDAVSVAAGVAGVPPRAFVVGTAVGETPWVVAGVLVGASVGSLAEAGSAPFDPRLVAGVALLGLLLLAGPAYRHLAGGGGGGDPAP